MRLFYLDIGVRDPEQPQTFIAAIECDGVSYHSEKSARDRDRLRQEILENLGWTIIRIWSTDWFRNPDGELRRVSAELIKLVDARKQQRTRNDSPARVKTDASKDKTDLKDSAEKAAPIVVTAGAGPIRSGISVDQARAQLVDLRERVIKMKYPDSDPSKGFLRKGLLDEQLRKRPLDLEEFRRSIRLDLREATDPIQLREFHDQVFDILSNVELTH